MCIRDSSNIVPWQLCCEASGAKIKVIPVKENGELDIDSFQKLLSSRTKLVCISHISNTLGTINPIKKIIKTSQKIGARVLIDGAQAVSHTQLNMQDLGADFYCFSAHKMYGPTGVGVLYGKEDILNQLPVYQGGGEMIKDVDFNKTTYANLPHKFEAGTPNIAGVIALKPAIDFISSIGFKDILTHENDILNYATNKLMEIKGLKIIGTSKRKTNIISFIIDNIHHYDIGLILDKMGVAIRTGHHCTQPLMKKLNISGTARISLAIYNTKAVSYTHLRAHETQR